MYHVEIKLKSTGAVRRYNWLRFTQVKEMLLERTEDQEISVFLQLNNPIEHFNVKNAKNVTDGQIKNKLITNLG